MKTPRPQIDWGWNVRLGRWLFATGPPNSGRPADWLGQPERAAPVSGTPRLPLRLRRRPPASLPLQLPQMKEPFRDSDRR